VEKAQFSRSLLHSPCFKEMLSPFALNGFYLMLRFGCWLKFVPYNWDHEKKLLKPASNLGVHLFSFHKNTMFILTLNVALGTILAYKRGDFPLPIKLVSGAWLHGYFLTSLGFSQFPNFRHEIMQFGNVVLERLSNANQGEFFKNNC